MRSAPPAFCREIAAHTTSKVAGNAVLIAAPAKVNLHLEILAKRPDGYHELETLMIAVDLFDSLEIVRTSAPELLLVDPPLGLPNGPGNLVYRAADELRRHVDRPLGAAIRLTKRIPHEAGLGGGSSDAAATLAALNHLWELNLPNEELLGIAAKLGSDVGFFLQAPAAWCRGRGEQVTPETMTSVLHLVVVKPPMGLSTAEVYKRVVVPEQPRSGTEIREAFQRGDFAAIRDRLHNRLQEPAFAVAPEVERGVQRLHDSGAAALLSGSGSAFLGLCPDRETALATAARYRAFPEANDHRVYVLRSLHP